jgi:hypothetical protein
VDNAPTPRPAMIRPTIIIGNPVAKVWKPPPMKNTMDPYRMVLRRPIMSPILPTRRDDINAPTSKIATTVPISARDG